MKPMTSKELDKLVKENLHVKRKTKCPECNSTDVEGFAGVFASRSWCLSCKAEWRNSG